MGSTEAGAPLHSSSTSPYQLSSPASPGASGSPFSRATAATIKAARTPGHSQPSSDACADQPLIRTPGPITGPREAAVQLAIVRYRGFVLIPQSDFSWLIRPERSPMRVLPFRAATSSLCNVKALIDWRLNQLIQG